MKIVAEFSYKGGKDFIKEHHPKELEEIKKITSKVDASKCKTKISEERGKKGKILYSPKKLNSMFRELFRKRGWKKKKILVTTMVSEINRVHRGSREMDKVKKRLGVEVQFGKYSFMAYDILAKMPLFSNSNVIDSGVEIVPMNRMLREMSSGVSSFEHIKTDLEHRGETGDKISIPVLVLGVDVKRLGKT